MCELGGKSFTGAIFQQTNSQQPEYMFRLTTIYEKMITLIKAHEAWGRWTYTKDSKKLAKNAIH